MDERDLPKTPAEQRVRTALGGLPPATADPAFRARLKEQFMAGAIAPRLRVVRPLWRRPAFAWSAAAVAAAAAFVAIAFLRTPSADWRVAGVEGAGTATVDGRAVPLDHAADLARALRHGGHVQLPAGASVDLVAPGWLAVTLSNGSDAVLPEVTGRAGAALRGEVRGGDVFFATGRRFHGSTFDIRSPEALTHVTGTMLAVLRDAEAGTCVCVMEGRVAVTANGEETQQVPAGMRIICPVEGGVEFARIRSKSEHALHRLHGRVQSLLQR